MSGEIINFRALLPFGVETDEISINEVMNDQVVCLKYILANNGFAVFRQQAVSDTDFVSFLTRLGPMTFTVGETPVLDQSALNVVTNVGRARPPRSVFHTDTSYVEQPPAFTALRAVIIPQSGGETLFSNQYCAYETLPSAVKAQLADVKVRHAISGVEGAGDQDNQSWHPLFLSHPLSNRLALFLSTPERCQEISGMTLTESQRAVRLLYRHSIRRHRLYYHRWQPDDIVIWDNRCTMHRADHSNVTGDRVLHRGLVLDDS
jgi:taurine dioxygenase